MKILISIIVPVYNEEEDISRTLEALAKQRYPDKEIIIVDDASQDNTAAIVEDYVRKYHFMGLIRQPVNLGAGSARNAGIRCSSGEILVILNADVFPEDDFLDRISMHYVKKEVGYVLVGAEIANQDFLFPRYFEAWSRFSYDGKNSIEWTEGFSCRRKAAFDVGLFPEGIPGCGGEDAIFGTRLSRKYRKVIDRSIVVPHVMPHTFKGFWLQQQSRGRTVPYIYNHVYKKPLALIALCLFGKFFYWLIRSFVNFPFFFLYYCYRSHQSCNRKWRDLAPFIYVKIVEMAANRVGEWKGWLELARKQESIF